jgi:hypothetical protein
LDPGQVIAARTAAFILGNAPGKGGNKTAVSPLDPWSESRLGLAPDHQVEFGDNFAYFDQIRDASFDRLEWSPLS